MEEKNEIKKDQRENSGCIAGIIQQEKASNVSTVQISAAMSISPGNLYYYYANKEDVIRCLWDERMSGKLDELLNSVADVKTAADLLDFIKAGLEYMIEYRFFYTEISTLFINDEKLVDIYREADKKMRDTFSDFVIRMGEEGKLIDYDEAARVMVIQNAVAVAKQMLDRYDVYLERGITREDFIGFSWLRIVSTLVPVFEEDMRAEIRKELEARGYNKERYLELTR